MEPLVSVIRLRYPNLTKEDFQANPLNGSLHMDLNQLYIKVRLFDRSCSDYHTSNIQEK
jgi:hypothetical protein